MRPKSISELTANSSVFLTGVTGFVGGCLLERLCELEPGPSRIFALVRSKDGLDPQTRLDRILSSPLFSRVPQRKLQRVLAIPGDVGSSGADLGLSEFDAALLAETCTHVFHAAASISFGSRLELAVRVNLLGSRAVVRLARRMKRLRAMVHVSTAYVNCTRGTEFTELREEIYPLDVDPVDFLNSVSSMTAPAVEAKYEEAIARHPNTYTFTKQLCEAMLARERGCLPLAIVRPSIILNSWREPFAGWLDSVNSAACGFIAGASKGVFCTLINVTNSAASLQARPDMVMDVIPVDLVVSTILAAALRVEREPERLHVFQCTSSTVNPTTWGRYCDAVIHASREHPCRSAAWYPRARPRPNRLRNDLVALLFQMLPAYFIDLLAAIAKPGYVMVDIQRRFSKGCRYASYFSLREWRFSRCHADELIAELPEAERDRHPMDPRQIDWDVYFEGCVLGTRTYFHGEPTKTSDIARRQMALLRAVAALLPGLSFTGLCCCLALLADFSWTLAASIAAFPVLLVLWL